MIIGSIPRSEIQHWRDFLDLARKSTDSIVAMQATCLRRRLDAIDAEQRRLAKHTRVDPTTVVPDTEPWMGAL